MRNFPVSHSHLRRTFVFLGVLTLLWLASVAQAQATYGRLIYPIAQPINVPRITIDITEAPDQRLWAEQAQSLVRQWFPLICQFLATEHYKPPKMIGLVFKKELSAPAYTIVSQIFISVPWITAHPDDFGMVLHELTHVIQAYPDSPNKPVWLVEGIADYIRYWRYEPEKPHPVIVPQKSSFRDGYGTTATFLAWLLETYDKRIIFRLDQAMRNGQDPLPVFHDLTGKTASDLWEEFLRRQ